MSLRKMILFAVLLFVVSLVHSDSLYVGVSSGKNYATAKSNCADLSFISGQLATWSSSADFNAIRSVRSQIGSNSWVGLDDLNSEANWKFVDGDTDYWYLII